MGSISRLQVSEFKKKDFQHGFFGRRGGVSTGIYDSLNIGLGAKDDERENVLENRRRIAADLGVTEHNIATVYQVHGSECVYAENPYGQENRPQADALVTDKKGLALGVLTADCAPVLFTGFKSDGTPVIGAAHAGWRGALAGILQSTVQKMLEIGAELESISACIGPCIQKRSYEVSTEFFEAFIKQSAENEVFFSSGQKPDHPHFDLSGYCAAQLSQAGVNKVIISGVDTYTDENEYFSCRRAAHRSEPDYGRQMSVIMI